MINKENWLSDVMKKEFQNFQSDRHKYMKPSIDSYMYFPSYEEIIEYNEKDPKSSIRRIFEGLIEYNQFELVKLKEIKDTIDKFNVRQNTNNSINLSSIKDSDLLRFLQASSFDCTKAFENLLTHLEWKKLNLPPKLTEKIMEILNIGLIYIHGRDCRFRPIINISANTYEKYKNKFTFSDIESAIIYLIHYILDYCLIPGQIENWVLILDLKDIYITSIPIELQKIISNLLNNYPCRLFIMYIINISGNTDFLWGTIKSVLTIPTQRKIKLLKQSNIKELFTYINPMHVENKLGGRAIDIKEVFFPGYIPKHECLLSGEKRSNIILDKESYSKLLKTKSRIAMCPYLETIDDENESDADDEINSSDDSSEKISLRHKKFKSNNNINHYATTDSKKKFSSKLFLKPVSSITQNDIFYQSFTNNFSMAKTEKIQDSQVDISKKKIDSAFNQLTSKSINNQLKKNYMRTSSFSQLMNDGIVINLNISNNAKDIKTIKDDYDKKNYEGSTDENNANPAYHTPSKVLNNKNENEIKEENITKKTCCTGINLKISSCSIF